MRQVVIYPGEDGYWVVECPSLPGCVSQGKTKEEAAQNIKEAIRIYPIWRPFYIHEYYFAKNCTADKKLLDNLNCDLVKVRFGNIFK